MPDGASRTVRLVNELSDAGGLDVDLAPARVLNELAREEIALAFGSFAILLAPLQTVAAMLTRFEIRVGFGIYLLGIFDVAQRFGGGFVDLQKRQLGLSLRGFDGNTNRRKTKDAGADHLATGQFVSHGKFLFVWGISISVHYTDSPAELVLMRRRVAQCKQVT